MVITAGNILFGVENMKNISKEQILDASIELMKDSDNLQNLNLRKIAKNLGCSHTNIYNYFSSYTDLLWEAHSELNRRIVDSIIDKVENTNTSEEKLNCMFSSIANEYLSNTGWFRFIWMYYIGDERPEKHVKEIDEIVKNLVTCGMKIAEDLWKIKKSENEVFNALHNSHCYMIGEITNFISKRRIIENEIELKRYLIEQAIKIFTFYIKEE